MPQNDKITTDDNLYYSLAGYGLIAFPNKENNYTYGKHVNNLCICHLYSFKENHTYIRFYAIFLKLILLLIK